MTLEQAGFVLCDSRSAGEVTCTGCWDVCDHDLSVDTCIPAGDEIWNRRTSYEYDEWDAYCRKCASTYHDFLLEPADAAGGGA